MSISLYISSTRIQAVEGNNSGKVISITRTLETEFPPEILVNGALPEEGICATILKEFWEEHNLPINDIHLVMYNRLVATKRMELPIVKDKETIPLVSREFSELDNDRDKEQIYTYQELARSTQDKMRVLLAAKTEKAELKKLLRICEQAGIPISTVVSGMDALVHMLSGSAEVRGKTSIVQICDGRNITNVLFLDGVYNYSSTTRIFEDHGTIGYAIEVARAVNGILQFMQANQITYDNMQVCLAGFRTEDVGNCFESVYQMNSGLEIIELNLDKILVNKGNAQIEDYLQAGSGLFKVGKTMDFLQQYRKILKKEKENTEVKNVMKPVIILVAVFTVVTAILGVMNLVEYRQLQAYEDYNNSDSVMAMKIAYKDSLTKALTSEALYLETTNLQSRIDSYPVANTSVEKVVRDSAEGYVDVSIVSFDAGTGVLTIETTAAAVENCYSFVEVLRQKDTFVKVDYSGYTYQEDKQAWQLNVTCYLAENAGKEAQ